jgi:hypothetical protein
MKGQAPYHVEFRWVYRPPLPFGLDPAARQAMIQQRLAEIFDDIDRASRREPPRTRDWIPISPPGAKAADGGGHSARPTWDSEGKPES